MCKWPALLAGRVGASTASGARWGRTRCEWKRICARATGANTQAIRCTHEAMVSTWRRDASKAGLV